MTTKKKTTAKKPVIKKIATVKKKIATVKKDVVVEAPKTEKKQVVYYGVNKEKIVFTKDIKGQNEPLLKEVHLIGRTEVVTPEEFIQKISEAK